MKRNLTICLIILVMMAVMFIFGLYAGGWFWLSVTGYQNLSPTLMTLINQGGIHSLNDKAKEMLPWAWCIPLALGFLPAGLGLFIWLGLSSKHRSLHGDARFATRHEIRKVWYTESEK
ncbi:hypothetical protein [Rahnella sp. ChDrAdgB13]|uniref:hypothetical protein n=1 Tax=Rahnella sp. ChDrAdgB13 TaxID=1850581 RepID=UPI001FCCA922|nr:hypothetical protein [Rahnella sp. ChDrAdgB13]